MAKYRSPQESNDIDLAKVALFLRNAGDQNKADSGFEKLLVRRDTIVTISEVRKIGSQRRYSFPLDFHSIVFP